MSTRNLVNDGLTAVMNGQRAKKREVHLPVNKLFKCIVEILKEKNYINAFELFDIEKKNFIKVIFKYDMFREGCIQEIKFHSKSSRRVYVDRKSIPRIRNGFATVIISTSKGVMTGYQAKEQGLGGELICHVF